MTDTNAKPLDLDAMEREFTADLDASLTRKGTLAVIAYTRAVIAERDAANKECDEQYQMRVRVRRELEVALARIKMLETAIDESGWILTFALLLAKEDPAQKNSAPAIQKQMEVNAALLDAALSTTDAQPQASAHLCQHCKEPFEPSSINGYYCSEFCARIGMESVPQSDPRDERIKELEEAVRLLKSYEQATINASSRINELKDLLLLAWNHSDVRCSPIAAKRIGDALGIELS